MPCIVCKCRTDTRTIRCKRHKIRQTITEFLDERQLAYQIYGDCALVLDTFWVVPYSNIYVAVAMFRDGVYWPTWTDRTIDPLDNFGAMYSIITPSAIASRAPVRYAAFGQEKNINIDEFTLDVWRRLTDKTVDEAASQKWT